MRRGTVRELRILEEAIDIWHVLGERWRRLAAAAIEARGVFTAALSGGRTPVGFYCYLSRQGGLPWKETELFQVDERHVSHESEDSNYAMIHSSLLRGGKVRPRGVHPVEITGSEAAASARRYEDDLRSFFGKGETGWPVFDLILLGIGGDGHTASLFPGGAELDEGRRWVTASRPAAARHDRITLTLPVLNECRNVAFLATGRDKAEMVRRVWEGGEDSRFPASMVHPRESLVIYVDKGAGSCG
jgi:6-phosphogluconolactonase